LPEYHLVSFEFSFSFFPPATSCPKHVCMWLPPSPWFAPWICELGFSSLCVMWSSNPFACWFCRHFRPGFKVWTPDCRTLVARGREELLCLQSMFFL
jgi:hypothetical protein